DPVAGCVLSDPVTTHDFEGELVGHLPGCWTATAGTWVVTADGANSSGQVLAQTEVMPSTLAIAMEGHNWSATDGLTVSWSMRTENTAGSGWGEHGVVLLYQDPQNYYAMRRDDNGSGHYQHILRVLDGVETSLANMGQDPTTTGTWGDFTVTATADGSQVHFTWDCNGWTGSVSDDSLWTSGRVGLRSTSQVPSSAHVLFDDVQIDGERVGATLCEAGTICDIGCLGNEDCAGDTTCLGKPSSAPGVVGKCVDTGWVEGSGDSCDLEDPCGPGLACLGEYAWGSGGWCVEGWFAKTFVSHETVGIPDLADVPATTSVVACGLASVPVDVYVTVDIDHPRPADLVVTLHDPNGETRVISDMEDVIEQMMVVGFPGDDSVNGVWSLEVSDQ
ncbi:MAG: proprotein convertase P-domain-containing protein, partial [Myxococcota bacterium]|nr:proprotein convertase P-domain-containing protein [Myxococcota bacterium]